MARYAKDSENHSPPRELLIGYDWKAFHTPLKAGGLEDQPAGLLRKIRAVMNYYDAIKEYDRSLGSGKIMDWINSNPDTYKIASEGLSFIDEE